MNNSPQIKNSPEINNNIRSCPDNCDDKQKFITNCQCGYVYDHWLLPHHTLAHDGCEIITKYK